MQLEPYLLFYGTCEEALKFYRSVFGGEISSLHRFEGSPMESQVPDKSKIMHASFEAPGVKFMASDDTRGGERQGSRITMSLGTNDVADAERVFNALASGGTIGMLTDKYGIDWMVNCEGPH